MSESRNEHDIEKENRAEVQQEIETETVIDTPQGADLQSDTSELGEDAQMTSDGYFILEGYMTEKYESAAYALYEGARSEVIEDENGYYVIERLEMTPLDIMAKFDYLKELYQSYTFFSLIDKKQATLTFTPNAAGEAFLKQPF